jgi:methylated-DNA-[protein]-cysteine S-methyltransferase
MLNMINQSKLAQSKECPSWDAVIAAPFGKLGILTEIVDGSLMVSHLVYLGGDELLKPPETYLAKELERQFKSYFKHPTFKFDLPLKPFGTAFQQRVWAEIEKIDCGEVKTYGELATAIKSAPRAVGQACGSNPYPLIVPCHRVISATGIGGFAHQAGEGFHRNVKLWLLQHEGVYFK